MALRITARRLSAIARGSAPLSGELAELARLALLGRATEQAPDVVVLSAAVQRAPQPCATWTFGVPPGEDLRVEGLLGCRAKLVRIGEAPRPQSER